VKPKLIVCLGRASAEYLIKINSKLEEKVLKKTLRGLQFIGFYISSGKELLEIPILCTWHPAYILRREDKRSELVEDLQLAKSLIE